jgi:hypothetical protein
MTTTSKETIALVLIHGIGEQRPMATLRGFVKDIFERPGQSKPDRLTDLFEVRRLNIEIDASLRIECRELYWAHHIDSSSWFHIVKWLGRLASTRAAKLREMGRHLDERLYTRTRGFALVMLALLAMVVVLAPFWVQKWGWPASLVALGVGAGGLVWAYFKRQMLDVVGDAARYLDNAPANIGVRQVIRTECMRFLDELNGSPEYSRIVVIGHSLGSVIAYDALRLLWARQTQHAAIHETDANRSLLAWLHGGRKPMHAPASSPQRALFERLLPPDGSPQPRWKISDLVTVGSPLTHAPLLFAGSVQDFEELKAQREFPTCPPQLDHKSDFCGWSEGGRLHLHHAAAFGVVRWTNLFFPSDPIGGPLQAVFGAGIEDVRLPDAPRGSWLDHVRYWKTGTAPGSAAFKKVLRRLIFEEAERRDDGGAQVETVQFMEEIVIVHRTAPMPGPGRAGS